MRFFNTICLKNGLWTGLVLLFLALVNVAAADDESKLKILEKTSETSDLDAHGHRRHGHSHGDAKPFIDGDTHVNATIGKSVSLTCFVHNVKNYKIAWYFNGILLTLNNNRIKDDKRFSVENPRPNEWKLLIDPVESANEGYYSCRVNNGLKRVIFLRVGTPPQFIGNNGSHQIVINTLEKQNITLSCEAEGSPVPTIYWYKNNKLIATGPHLGIKDINRHSHSEYECVARNTIEPDPSRHFKINVNFKPSINLMYHIRDQDELRQGNLNDSPDLFDDDKFVGSSDLEVVCEIVGNPVNSIGWFKDKNTPLKDSINISKQPHGNYHYQKQTKITTDKIGSNKFISKLKIRNYDVRDNGEYECRVNGLEGDVSKFVYINEIKGSKISEENAIGLNSKSEYSIGNKKSEPRDYNRLELTDISDEAGSKSKSRKANEDPKSHQITSHHNLIESNYLVQSGHGRGARSNSTNLKDDLFENNSARPSREAFAISRIAVTILGLLPILLNFV